MQSWHIGDVTITKIDELQLVQPYIAENPFITGAAPEELQRMPWLHPHFVTPEGLIKWSVHALLVETPALCLIVDTCMGNDKPHRLTNNEPLKTDFLEKLAALGRPRESIDIVVCTHLHVDHVGWNTMLAGDGWAPTFPNARYLIGKAEYDHWQGAEGAGQKRVMSQSIAPIFEAGLVDLVETDHRICDEIQLIPTCGHTPGHVSVSIQSKGERALITGDMIHHPCQVTRPEWGSFADSDPEAARATRRKFVSECADAPVLIIGTHFAAPTAGRIRRDGDAFRFAI
ncbi:MAG: MBL fold metallo-hydrolase [Hyphomonadaceae bacterium]